VKIWPKHFGDVVAGVSNNFAMEQQEREQLKRRLSARSMQE